LKVEFTNIHNFKYLH